MIVCLPTCAKQGRPTSHTRSGANLCFQISCTSSFSVDRVKQFTKPFRAAERAARFTVPGEQRVQLRQLAASSAAITSTAPSSIQDVSLPRTPLQMVEQAGNAILRGLEDGKKRQKLQLLNPVNEKEVDFLATEAVDYPCSLQKEFEMAVNLCKAIVQHVKGSSTTVMVKRLDDGGIEGEPCAAVYNEDKDFVMIVYPISDRLKDIQSLAKDDNRAICIVNPQWNDSGQVVSDFGFGPWKKAAETFLATFEQTYRLVEQRIGAPGSVNAVTQSRFATGGVVRTLKVYPFTHKAFAMAADGSSQALAEFSSEPSYQELDKMLTDGRAAKAEIFKVAREATAIRPEDEPVERPLGPPQTMASDRASDLASLTAAQVAVMDLTSLQQTLFLHKLPVDGKISKLRERLTAALPST